MVVLYDINIFIRIILNWSIKCPYNKFHLCMCHKFYILLFYIQFEVKTVLTHKNKIERPVFIFIFITYLKVLMRLKWMNRRFTYKLIFNHPFLNSLNLYLWNELDMFDKQFLTLNEDTNYCLQMFNSLENNGNTYFLNVLGQYSLFSLTNPTI